LQCGCEILPRILRGSIDANRVAISFFTGSNQRSIFHCGMAVSRGDIIVHDPHLMHQRTQAPCSWSVMSATRNDLSAAAEALAARELVVPSRSRIMRPSAPLMTRLINLQDQANQLARFEPHRLAHPQVARALEEELVHAMILCLTESAPIELDAGPHRHRTIVARLDEFLAANQDRPVYLAEICSATGVSERTLRVCCQAYLGMSVMRYLWIRRMNIARRKLLRADPRTATVTEIACDCGFWEFGRFSVEYRMHFGEPPSASLRQSPTAS
jgi:AraC-like DNA-binding protein